MCRRSLSCPVRSGLGRCWVVSAKHTFPALLWILALASVNSMLPLSAGFLSGTRGGHSGEPEGQRGSLVSSCLPLLCLRHSGDCPSSWHQQWGPASRFWGFLQLLGVPPAFGGTPSISLTAAPPQRVQSWNPLPPSL